MSNKSFTRERKLHFTPNRPTVGLLQTMTRTTPSGAPSVVAVSGGRVTGRQVTSSEENAWYKIRRAEPVQSRTWDIGGNFDSSKHEFESTFKDSYTCYSDARDSAIWTRYTGPLFAHPLLANNGTFPVALNPGDLHALGSTAIARVLPTNPAADAATFIGELTREGLPSIVGAQLLSQRSRPPRGAASEYLNWEFGWAPVISDLEKFRDVAIGFEGILEQYRRDSGRNVRRRYSYPEDIETTETKTTGTQNVPWPLSSAYFDFPEQITKTVRTRKTRKVWFSGCFTYYLDPGDTALGRASRHAQEARKLLNLELTPEVVWNLAPWSWAVDWFSNAGDVFHNMSAFQQDGLVMRYGYIMETTSHEVSYTLSNVRFKRSPVTQTLTDTYRIVRKRRERATPYGFGVKYDGLTNRQLAIVLALGITKGKNPRDNFPG